MSYDEEKAYDERIAPLMAQIIEVCKERRIPMVATFQYADAEGDGPAYCTTVLPFKDRSSDHLRKLAALASPAEPFVLAETVATGPDGAREISIRRIR